MEKEKMSFFISKIILHNRAPFDNLEIGFTHKGISVLTAVNGGGKTTILSHIADAWYELVRKAFSGEFDGKENKYYRISSNNFSMIAELPSIAYIRFEINDENIDYIDVRGKCTEEQYNSIIKLADKIPFEKFQKDLDSSNYVKYISNQDAKQIERIFNENIVTYFPAYRYEQPGYLNDPFKIMIEYGLKMHFSGYLRNPIEVISDLPQLANWLMDVVLEMALENGHSEAVAKLQVETLFKNINEVFTNVLSIKSGNQLFIGIGGRTNSITRIQVGEHDKEGRWLKTVYPSIFNLSSGENAMICLFGEIIRQFDNIYPNQLINKATGVVLIDEVDKHLHIRLQKEILPKLFQLFPNIQFIISSHSPFVAMGLEENKSVDYQPKIIDLDNGGIETSLLATKVFSEGYNAMVEKNEQYKKMYEQLKCSADPAKLQIVSEGYNCEHIKRAINVLDHTLLQFLEFPYSDRTGKEQLKQAYDALFTSNPQTKYLFIWDCDFTNKNLSENEHFYGYIFEKNGENTKVIKGIENIYPMELFIDEYYIEKKQINGYGAKTVIQEFNKNLFLEFIKSDNEQAHFLKYKPLIDKIRSILG
ncbi:MAG: AAA family ATPase [Acidaminococcaceae bacterium]